MKLEVRHGKIEKIKYCCNELERAVETGFWKLKVGKYFDDETAEESFGLFLENEEIESRRAGKVIVRDLVLSHKKFSYCPFCGTKIEVEEK